MLATDYVLHKAVEVTDWLISVGASETIVDDLLSDLFDVYAVKYDEYRQSLTDEWGAYAPHFSVLSVPL